MMTPHDLYTDIPPSSDVHTAARIMGCSHRKVRELIASGDLGHVRLGRLIRIPRHCIIEFLVGNADAPAVADEGAFTKPPTGHQTGGDRDAS